MSEMKTQTQVSAGGVAFRRVEDHVQVALISVGPESRWQIPKGMVEAGEDPLTAARREVREEAGIETQSVCELETIEYWFAIRRQDERIRIHKFVHLYLLEYVSGDVSDHDHEVNEARWYNLADAIETLTFDNEKAVMRKAAEIITTQ